MSVSDRDAGFDKLGRSRSTRRIMAFRSDRSGMSSSEYRQRVAEHPQSLPGAVGGVLVTLGLVVALRIAAGLFIDDAVHPITYLAVAGGGLGSIAMLLFVRYTDDELQFAPIEFWANQIGDGRIEKYRRQGTYLHVTYGAVVAGFFPRIIHELTGGGAGNLFAQYPLSIVTGLAFGAVLFVLGIVYSRLGFFELSLEPESVGRFLSTHVVYGLALGVTTGLMRPLLKPILGF